MRLNFSFLVVHYKYTYLHYIIIPITNKLGSNNIVQHQIKDFNAAVQDKGKVEKGGNENAEAGQCQYAIIQSNDDYTSTQSTWLLSTLLFVWVNN